MPILAHTKHEQFAQSVAKSLHFCGIFEGGRRGIGFAINDQCQRFCAYQRAENGDGEERGENRDPEALGARPCPAKHTPPSGAA
jgi:hypothetical protein